MTRTKSMIYRPTEEARELLIVATNNGTYHRSMILPIITNLRRKYKKGTFDHDKAADAFYRVATAASDHYRKDYGYGFTVADRFTAAVDMVNYYMEDITE